MIIFMFRMSDIQNSTSRPRAWFFCVLLVAHFTMLGHQFGHEFEPDHTDAETNCSWCLAAERLEDSASHDIVSADASMGQTDLHCLADHPAAPSELPLVTSRGPPLRV